MSSLTSDSATAELHFTRPETLRGSGYTVRVEPHLSLALVRIGVVRRPPS